MTEAAMSLEKLTRLTLVEMSGPDLPAEGSRLKRLHSPSIIKD